MVSSHADRFGFICPGFKISLTKMYAAFQYNRGEWNLVCVAHGIKTFRNQWQHSFPDIMSLIIHQTLLTVFIEMFLQ